MNNEVYKIIKAIGPEVPIIIGAPHVGTNFPEDVMDQFIGAKTVAQDDTDWFIHKLYDFAPVMGIDMIHAVNSRWVVDLNRDPKSKPLYNDGRIITGLCTTTDFFGEDIYKPGKEPNQVEIDRRVEKYYDPYYIAIQTLIDQKIKKFGKCLFFDAHSIRKRVETIRPDDFPDLILGDNDEKTAPKNLIDATMNTLSDKGYTLTYNTPFKGGQITRHFGQPEKNQYTLQLEMAKINYMDDEELNYHPERAEKMRAVLKEMFEKLIFELS